jgi:guanylate kinase
MRKGIPIVISAASGTGKTSLCTRLLKTLSHVSRSISYTTRPPRGDEVPGRDYHYVDEPEFARMIADGEFIEWAEVFGKRYGTGIRAVQEQLDEGVDVLLDIDVQGGAQIRDRLPNALLIFLLPPSMDELRRRLVNRAEDAPEVIERRFNKARDELLSADQYDFLVVNDDFEQAALDLRAIIRAHRLKVNAPRELLARLIAG